MVSTLVIYCCPVKCFVKVPGQQFLYFSGGAGDDSEGLTNSPSGEKSAAPAPFHAAWNLSVISEIARCSASLSCGCPARTDRKSPAKETSVTSIVDHANLCTRDLPFGFSKTTRRAWLGLSRFFEYGARKLLAVSVKQGVTSCYSSHHMLSRSGRDLGIDFAADVHDESHEVQPEHQDDHCAETSISGVVTWSVLDIREKR